MCDSLSLTRYLCVRQVLHAPVETQDVPYPCGSPKLCRSSLSRSQHKAGLGPVAEPTSPRHLFHRQPSLVAVTPSRGQSLHLDFVRRPETSLLWRLGLSIGPGPTLALARAECGRRKPLCVGESCVRLWWPGSWARAFIRLRRWQVAIARLSARPYICMLCFPFLSLIQMVVILLEYLIHHHHHACGCSSQLAIPIGLLA